MIRTAAFVVLLVALPCVAADSIDPQTAAAVARGLSYLAHQQQTDGSFAAGFDDPAPRGRTTAAALLAMMSAGQTATNGRYSLAVHNGLAFLLRTSPGDGYFGLADDSGASGQAWIIIALAEAYGTEGNATQRGQIGPLLRAGLAATLATQDKRDAGGWGEHSQSPGDLTATAMTVLALRSLQDAGMDVPPDAIHRGAAFARSCKNGSGFADAGQQPTPLSTAAGACILLLAHEVSATERPGLLKTLADLKPADDESASYFVSIAGVFADVRQPRIQDVVRKKQGSDGSWTPAHSDIPGTSTVFSTAQAIMSLTTPYRLLPIYPLDK